MAELNVANRAIFTGDNLDILRGINSECVDLIYLDPPFNSRRHYAAPLGSPAEGAEFRDIWTLDDIKEVQVEELKNINYGLHAIITAARYSHGPAMTAYLTVMGIRLLEIHRILKPTGSVYLHCDPTASHYIKGMMDAVFGVKNLIAEIIWSYGTASGGRAGGRRPVKGHEILLTYARNYGRHTFNRLYLPYAREYVQQWFRHTDEQGRQFQTRSRQGRIIRQYLDESPGVPLSTVWPDIRQLYGSAGWFPSNRKEITGYPTQKPLALLERVINLSSRPGDLVLDPFCGCATACVAAERLGRQWIGVDIAPRALELTKLRMARELQISSDVAPTLTDWEVRHYTAAPARTDNGAMPPRPHTAIPAASPSRDIKRALYGKQEGFCNGCDLHFRIRNLTLDHIVPRALGGADTDSNLQLLCSACNSKKGTRTQEEFLAILVREGIRR